MSNPTTAIRKSERELVVTRTFDAPARIVFEAWSKAELFSLWWPPKSLGMTLRSCEMDVRTGGGYRLEFGPDAENAMAFFGRYLEVTPPSRPDAALSSAAFEGARAAAMALGAARPLFAAAMQEAASAAREGGPAAYLSVDLARAPLGDAADLARAPASRG